MRRQRAHGFSYIDYGVVAALSNDKDCSRINSIKLQYYNIPFSFEEKSNTFTESYHGEATEIVPHYTKQISLAITQNPEHLRNYQVFN